MDGWIKLHRCSFEKGWLRNHKMWAFWSYCLIKANHKDKTIIFNNTEVFLKKGQFIFGSKQASKDLNISRQSLRTIINHLKTMQNITVKPTNKYSIITIINWDIYQNKENENNQQSNQQLTNNQPSTNQQLTTDKNVKNVKNDKKKKKITKKKFIKPTLEELKKFALELGSWVDPEYFLDTQITNGWILKNGNPVKNWKSCFRTWHKNDIKYNPEHSEPKPPPVKLKRIPGSTEKIRQMEKDGVFNGAK